MSQEHPAIRFLWLLPLAIMLLTTVIVWPIPNKLEASSTAMGLVICGGGASWIFYKGHTEIGFSFLALAISPAVLGLLDAKFEFASGLPERPTWVHTAEQFAILIVALVMVIWFVWKPRHLLFIVAAFSGSVYMLALLVKQIGPWLGLW